MTKISDRYYVVQQRYSSTMKDTKIKITVARSKYGTQDQNTVYLSQDQRYNTVPTLIQYWYMVIIETTL